MLRRFGYLIIAALMMLCRPAQASLSGAVSDNTNVPAMAIYCMTNTGTAIVCNFGGGTGGTGGAVNATLGAFVDGAIVTLGTEADSVWSGSGSGTLIAIDKYIATHLGTPFQAGGSIANTSFGATQAGTWQVNLGTLNGAATATLQSSLITALGSPFQAGASIGNTTFGATQSGTWSVSVSNLPATQPVSGTFWQTTQPISAASLPLPAGAATSTTNAPVAPATGTATNSVLIGCVSNTSLPAFTAGQQGALACNTTGQLDVNITNNTPTYLQSVSSGGASSLSSINAAASAMATNVKASAGQIYGYDVDNNTSSAIFFRIFNLATAPTVGSSTPLLRKVVPAGASATFETPVGLSYPSGISFDVTTGSLADSDTSTITTANQATVTIFYK